MFKRFWIHFWLIATFALVQMGAATHEISHIKDVTQQSQSKQNLPEKHSGDAQCSLCIAYAQIAHADVAVSFALALITAFFALASVVIAKLQTRPQTHYLARAPPLTSSI